MTKGAVGSGTSYFLNRSRIAELLWTIALFLQSPNGAILFAETHLQSPLRLLSAAWNLV